MSENHLQPVRKTSARGGLFFRQRVSGNPPLSDLVLRYSSKFVALRFPCPFYSCHLSSGSGLLSLAFFPFLSPHPSSISTSLLSISFFVSKLPNFLG